MGLVQMLCSLALHLVQRSHDVCHQDHERLGPPGVVEPRGVLTPSGLHQKVIRTGMSWHFMVFHGCFFVFCALHLWNLLPPFPCHQSSCSPDRHSLGFNGQNQAQALNVSFNPSIVTTVAITSGAAVCLWSPCFPIDWTKKGVSGGGWCRVWWGPEERMNAHVWHQLMIVLIKNWYIRFKSNDDSSIAKKRSMDDSKLIAMINNIGKTSATTIIAITTTNNKQQ